MTTSTALAGDAQDYAQLIGRLQQLDTSAVSDAMDALGLNGVVTGIRPVWPCPAVAGRVVPVGLVPAGQATPPPHHLGTAAIASAGPLDVIVVDNRGRLEMGGWGGLLARGALAREVAGVVVDGACRDVDEIAAIKFPAFARGSTARTGRGRVVETVVDEIEIGGVTVRRDDLVLADGTAVVFLPRPDAERIIGASERIVARETAMGAALRAGLPATEVMGLDYEELIERMRLEGR
jgi:4-hydroxy-4-methyl-2-oxoglutarate aldolase